jgi:hypothetical protein
MPDRKPLGRIASPDDPADYSIRALLAVDALTPVLPRRYRVVSARRIGRFDQQENSCVGQSLALVKIVQERRDMFRHYPIDPLSIWDRSKQRDGIGNPTADRGTYIRTALDCLREGASVSRGGTVESRFRIDSYYRCWTIEEVKAAIYAFGCVAIGQDWPDSWFDTPADGRVPEPTANAGGHATAGYGWDDDLVFDWLPGEKGGLWAANSWNEAFGKVGDYAIPYSLIGQGKLVDEVWKPMDWRN